MCVHVHSSHTHKSTFITAHLNCWFIVSIHANAVARTRTYSGRSVRGYRAVCVVLQTPSLPDRARRRLWPWCRLSQLRGGAECQQIVQQCRTRWCLFRMQSTEPEKTSDHSVLNLCVKSHMRTQCTCSWKGCMRACAYVI